MTLHKKDLIMLAGTTLSWAAQKECVKIGDSPYGYFTVQEWCDYFEHSNHTFKRVKYEMVELGIMIAQRVMHGHYISDNSYDTIIHFELNLKNIVTRLETHLALYDRIKKSKHSEELINRLRVVVDELSIRLDDEGMLTLPKSKIEFLEASVE